MDLQNDMHFYQEKFPSTHTTYNSIKTIVNGHDVDPVGAVFGVEVASDWNEKCYGFEIDKVTSENTYVQYVGIWKT
jgi:hypothetical protein